ncbi:MAG: hypothetical protein SFW65_01750 [Alphaproteobacteria bacterium]|nr:hypothetical protein [Alphaproteobacteria bacterium]
MAEDEKQHFRILYYKGNSSIIGVGDLFIEVGNPVPEPRDGAFIVSDAHAHPLDWNAIKDTPYVQSLSVGVQKMIKQTLLEEKLKAARPVVGKDAMILDDKKTL